MKDNLNGRQPKWKTTLMEDDLNGRQPQWKMTIMEDDHNGRQPQLKTNSMEDDLNGRQTSMEDDLNGRRPQWKTTSRKSYRKQMTSACLASKSCTELGPAQPQLVSISLTLFSASGAIWAVFGGWAVLLEIRVLTFTSFFNPGHSPTLRRVVPVGP